MHNAGLAVKTLLVVPVGRTAMSVAQAHPAEPRAGEVVQAYTVFSLSEVPENLNRSRQLILALPIESNRTMLCVRDSVGIGAAVTTTFAEALSEVLESLDTISAKVRGTVDAARIPLVIVIVGADSKARTLLSRAEVHGDENVPADTIEHVQVYVRPWSMVAATSGSREPDPSITRSFDDLTSCELPPEIKAEMGDERTLISKIMKDDACVASMVIVSLTV